MPTCQASRVATVGIPAGPFLRAVGALAPGARTALRAGLAAAVVAPGAALLGATAAVVGDSGRRCGGTGPWPPNTP